MPLGDLLLEFTEVAPNAPCDAVPDILTEVTSPLAVESSDTTPVIVIVKSLAGDKPAKSVPRIVNV